MTRALKERLKAGAVVAVCNTDYPTPQLVEYAGSLGCERIERLFGGALTR